MSDGMSCTECNVEHADWTELTEYGIDDGYHCGVITVLQCGLCGEPTEVARQ